MRTKFEKICADFHSEVARVLTYKKLSQVAISKKLCITQPAVSQYLNNTRGNGYVNDKYRILINDICNQIFTSDDRFYIELLKMCIQRYEDDIKE